MAKKTTTTNKMATNTSAGKGYASTRPLATVTKTNRSTGKATSGKKTLTPTTKSAFVKGAVSGTAGGAKSVAQNRTSATARKKTTTPNTNKLFLSLGKGPISRKVVSNNLSTASARKEQLALKKSK